MKNIKRIAAMVIAVCIVLSTMTVAFAAEKYTIDLNSIPNEQFTNCRVRIVFEYKNTNNTVFRAVEGDDYMGYPVLMNLSSLGGGITLIPIRAVCDALGVAVEWHEATATEKAHAVISTPEHGDVKLYMGATSITAADGYSYEEKAYTFPDGSRIPLCLNRNGRIYVPVRFISNFLLKDCTFGWSQNMVELKVSGVKNTVGWDGVGVNIHVAIPAENPTANLTTTAAANEKHGIVAVATGAGASFGFIKLKLFEDEGRIVISGCEWKSESYGYPWDTTVALIKDLLDAESATAFINWLEEANRLYEAAWTYTYGSDEYNKAASALTAYTKPLHDGYVQFGNVYVKLPDTALDTIEFRNA